ncbi:hypothetical protein [Ectobacillus antri]|uniref:hypothetical protein n=1 Tax=Ectobacillus antri TaxID=2486280 RepID=UPI000F597E0D|nr:hypothetical protein [Ectobacillus antri]
MADLTFTAPYRAAMTTKQAQAQAGNELSALYQRALQNVKSQLYNNQVMAAEQAAARGLSHSGLAQDAQNKLMLGAQGQIGDMEAERASKVAALARQILERDQDVGFRERQQAYSEWNGQQGLRMEQDRFNYQKERDKVADGQWQQEFSLQKQRAASSGRGGSGGSRGRSGSPRPAYQADPQAPKINLPDTFQSYIDAKVPTTNSYAGFMKQARLIEPEAANAYYIDQAKDARRKAYGG